MDQKDSNEGGGSCVYACKAQASAQVDVPRAPMTLKYTIGHADDGSGCARLDLPARKAQHARHHVRYKPERQQQQ